MTVKLLAIDLDGTLLRSDRTIHPRSGEAVRRAVQAGIIVVLASGRNQPSIRPFAEQLGLTYPVICSNGAHVIGRAGEEIHHFGVENSIRDSVIAYALDHRVQLNIYCRDQLFFMSETPWGEIYEQRVRTIKPTYITREAAVQLEPTKLMIVDDPAKILGHAKNLEQIVSISSSRMTLSEPEYLEFLSGSADKGKGLEALANSLSIKRENVAAIGDYLNDLEMVSWAGTSGAVGNADPVVKSAAKQVFATNDEGGVADFIDSFVSNTRE